MSYVPPSSLVPLFRGGGQGLPVVQGRLTAWNATTLANTVEVQGQPLTGLAVLAPAVSDLSANVTVLLVPIGANYIIAGRIRVPTA